MEIIVVVIITVRLASSPIVFSLVTGVCEPDVVTYTTLAQELKKNLSGMCDTKESQWASFPVGHGGTSLGLLPASTVCQQRRLTSRKKKRMKAHMRTSSNEQLWEMNGERIQEANSPWCVRSCSSSFNLEPTLINGSNSFSA